MTAVESVNANDSERTITQPSLCWNEASVTARDWAIRKLRSYASSFRPLRLAGRHGRGWGKATGRRIRVNQSDDVSASRSGSSRLDLRNVFSTCNPPSTTPSTINDISSLGRRFGSSEPKQPPSGGRRLPSHETGFTSATPRPTRYRDKAPASLDEQICPQQGLLADPGLGIVTYPIWENAAQLSLFGDVESDAVVREVDRLQRAFQDIPGRCLSGLKLRLTEIGINLIATRSDVHGRRLGDLVAVEVPTCVHGIGRLVVDDLVRRERRRVGGDFIEPPVEEIQ